MNTYSEIALFSEEGREILGDQLSTFEVSPEGHVSTSEPRRLRLNHTEERDFYIRGEVRLGGTYRAMRYPEDFLSGFSVFVRAAGGLYRYELNPERIRNKRRPMEGEAVNWIQHVELFPTPELDKWSSFAAWVSKEEIVFWFEDEMGRIEGPVATDGQNEIGLVPGSSLRDVRISFPGSRPEAVSMGAEMAAASDSYRADSSGDGLSDDDVAALGLNPSQDHSALFRFLSENPEYLNGVFSSDQIKDLALGRPLLERDPSTGRFNLHLALQQSTDLDGWNAVELRPDDLSTTPEGLLRINIPVSEGNTEFFRLHSSPEEKPQ